MLPIRENLAGGAGMIVMLLLVAVAVAMFISCGGMTSPYAYLEAEVFETEYGVSGMVRERQRQYRSTYTRYNVLAPACVSFLPFLCSAARSSRKTGFFLWACSPSCCS